LGDLLAGGAVAVGAAGTLAMLQQWLPCPNALMHQDNKDDEEDSEEETSQRFGGGKNAQHGKANDLPSHLRQLQDLQQQLQQAQMRKDKEKIKNKMKNIREEMRKRRTGENHSQKPKT
jgi:hypothetical protein